MSGGRQLASGLAALLDGRPGARRLLVTTSYPRFAGDAAGGFVAARVAALAAAGEHVSVIAAGQEGQEGEAGEADVRRVPFALPGAVPLFYADGAPERLEADPAGAWLQALRLWGGLLAAIRAARAADPAPELVESHWLVPCALAVAATQVGGKAGAGGVDPAADPSPGGRGLGAKRTPHPPGVESPQKRPNFDALGRSLPHVAHVHSGDVALLERLPLAGSLLGWVLARCDALVVASADLRARLERLAGRPLGEAGDPATPPGPAAVVRPATSSLVERPGARPPARLLPSLRARQGCPPGRPVILAVGRLVPIKGHDLLVRAVARLPRLPSGAAPVTLVILGEGPARPTLEALARARRLDLRLPGQVPPAQVRAWLEAADLFVQPSRSLPGGRTEGLPVAAREALAAGLPLVASASGGLVELAGAAAGDVWLVPPGDVAALGARLDWYLRGTGQLPGPDSDRSVRFVSGV